MIRSSTSKIILAATIVLVVAAILCVYFVYDPAETASFPKCPSKLITGFDCPGCGSQRALHSLLHGDFAGVVHHNALLVVAVPFLIVLLSANMLRHRFPRFHDAVNSNISVYSTLAVVIIWTIVRNI